MNDFATKFTQAKSPEEFIGLVGDVIRGNPGGTEPIFTLIAIASEMAIRCSKPQREQVVTFMRTQVQAIDAGLQ